jgi:hypothetical protein
LTQTRREMLMAISQRLSGREMSVREKGLWAQALKALDDARLSGEIELGAGVRIDVGCCDEMLYAALAAGCRYDEDEVLAYTAAVASTLALQPHSEPQVGFGVGTVKPRLGLLLCPENAAVAEEAVGAPAQRTPRATERRRRSPIAGTDTHGLQCTRIPGACGPNP